MDKRKKLETMNKIKQTKNKTNSFCFTHEETLKTGICPVRGSHTCMPAPEGVQRGAPLLLLSFPGSPPRFTHGVSCQLGHEPPQFALTASCVSLSLL